MTFINLVPVKDLELLQDNYHKYYGEMPINLNFTNTFAPKIDISEDEKNYYFEAEIPGTKKEEIKITIENYILTIKGEKKLASKGKIIHSERVYGTFSRSFNLNEDINHDTVTAEFENGILRISIGKAVQKSVKEQQIKIK